MMLSMARRHLTKGQQAMATALAYPEPKKSGRKKKGEMVDSINDFDKAYLSHARFVLRNCRDKALEVLRNAKYPLTVAYEEAQAIVEKQRIAEEERQRQLAALAVLRKPENFAGNFQPAIVSTGKARIWPPAGIKLSP